MLLRGEAMTNRWIDSGWLMAFAASCGLLGAACGGDGSSVPDASPRLDAAGPDAATECSLVNDVGSLVEQTSVATAVPMGTGGAIADGRYVMTHWFLYTGAGGGSGGTGHLESVTIDVSGGVANGVITNALGGTELHAYTLTVNGTAVAVIDTCPMVGTHEPWDHFSQVGNVVTLYSSSIRQAQEYTLMP